MDDKKKLYILSAIAFMDLFAVGLTVPLFANHVRELGGTHFLTGLLGSVYPAAQLFFSPLIGSWSDIRGRKTVLKITLLVSSLSYFITGFTTSLCVLFIARTILGCTKHTQTLCKAFIADTVSKDEQSTAYGFNASVSMIGFIVGPVLGGHLSELKNGYFYVFTICSILFLINILLTNILPTPKIQHETKNNKIQKEVLRVLTDLKAVNWKNYWTLFTSKLFHQVAITIFFFNYGMMLRETYGVSQKLIGYTIAFQSLLGTLAGFLSGTISKKFYKNDATHTKKYFYSFLIVTFAFLLICLSNSLYTFLISLIPLAIANSLLRITETEILLAKSKNEKGSLVGTSNSISSVSRLVGPIISGSFSDILGQNSVMYLSFILASAGASIAGITHNRTKQKVS